MTENTSLWLNRQQQVLKFSDQQENESISIVSILYQVSRLLGSKRLFGDNPRFLRGIVVPATAARTLSRDQVEATIVSTQQLQRFCEGELQETRKPN